jgi:hypothetical protein
MRRAKKITYEAILDIHRLFCRLRRCNDIKVSNDRGDDNLEHHLRNILSSADPRSGPKRHHVLRHEGKSFSRTWPTIINPALGHKVIWAGEYFGSSVHRPSLSGNDGLRREPKSQKVVVFYLVGLRVRPRNHAFKQAGGGRVNKKTWSIVRHKSPKHKEDTYPL